MSLDDTWRILLSTRSLLNYTAEGGLTAEVDRQIENPKQSFYQLAKLLSALSRKTKLLPSIQYPGRFG